MRAEVVNGDMRIAVPLLEPGFDSCVTDPPYELGFMGRAWDKSGVSFQVGTWRAVYGALKPGAHLLAFGGTRTVHRIACAIEDAGFEIRDQIQWLYGSGFPKSRNVSKEMEKEAYFEEAERWQGWGTGLKPACEPIVVARKPLSESTVAANVLKYGTGAINVDASRVRRAADDRFDYGVDGDEAQTTGESGIYGKFAAVTPYAPHAEGRWPANVILGCACEVEHDEGCAVRLLDEQSGVLTSNGQARPYRRGENNVYGKFNPDAMAPPRQTSKGGASRFFYCAKATKEERRGGSHPTVKPVALMRYLVRLVTPKAGRVLDPFAGTFKTGEGCVFEGFDFTGVELEEGNCTTGRLRLKRARGEWAEMPRPNRRQIDTPLFGGAA